MTSLKETLWLTLEDLRAEEFKQLKWHLQQADIMHTIVPHGEAYRAIPTTRLEKADRQDTVDQMVQIYNLRGALEVTRGVLIKINRNDLVQQLPNITATSKAAWEVDVGDVGISSENRRDLMVPVPKPPQPITSYQKMLQSNLQNRFICVHEGLSDMEDKKLLDDIYTELYITDGGNMQINRQHEVRQIEMAARQPAKIEISVKPSDIFKHPSGKYRPIRTVLTNGIAGIGKTFLVQKFILDWAEGRNNQDVHLIFPFTFRQLNLLKGKRFCLAKLIHKCIRETKDITEDALNYIFTTLQTSGNTNYDKSKFKLLFVLDGLDENRLQLDFTAKETKVLDVTNSTGVEGLLMNLIKGTLLPSSRLWITTRPAAANQISLELVDMVSEVRGFTDPQKEEYFTKKFSHHGHADRIISHIRASRSLYIMCYIPVFCWITATVLQDVLQTSEGVELPKTLTEMYTEFLAFQMKQTKEKYGTKKCIRYIESLAKLAFHQLEKGNIIFYEEDLKHSGIDLSEASMYSGVFTQIFKRERWRKKDKEKGRMFSFVHLSIQEFLAAFYVQLSLVNGSKNVMAESQAVSRNLGGFFCKTSATEVHRSAIDKALASPEGHLDLFLRFLLGLSLQTNKDLLADLLGRKPMSPSSNQETIQYIKEKIEQDLSPERSINLFHCLNELNDHSLVEDIQDYISSGCIFQRYLTPAQWSGLVFILLSSEKKHDVFDLKKYSASHGGLLRLLPVFQDSTTYLLSGCNLSDTSFKALVSVLTSEQSKVRELDLSSNNPDDVGVTALSAALENPCCRVESLRLSACNLSEGNCDSLASVLGSGSSNLRELDLGDNNLQDSGVKLLAAGLESPHCTLESLRLNLCKLSSVSCEALASVLSSRSSCLRQLDLSNNDLLDSGVKLLAAGLANPRCRLETLRLSGCLVTEEGCASLASALSSNPSHLRELDLSYNHPGVSGAAPLSAGLDDPRWRLDTLKVDPSGVCWLKSGLRKYAGELTLDLNTAHRDLVLSDGNRSVTKGDDEQPYPDGPERFCDVFQLLCREGLTGRHYWEVEWKGRVWIGAAYSGISRSGKAVHCLLGGNEKSWCLECTDDAYYSWHNKSITSIWFHPLDTTRVAAYLDWPAGTLSFYRLSSDTVTHLYTFYSTFDEPVYPGFWIGLNCSATLCQMEEEAEEEELSPV
ncbi:NACHT, LRR and PYD domains-containing protein 3 isoform X3 [Scophthalmus maximus]|uniref:NACHT, LRR and PYD domains-containing protein 3 isoform X3 n=1 Tax=Scophthalmus maximus TaxID=52904 RepID=UPI001FA8A7F3|nr:NACHT, LRR and PYD domains-containing protein 3 isoform X3 [Scophthalmus maximus]